MFITYKGQGKADVKIIEVEDKRNKGEEVIVHYDIVYPRWKARNYEDFSREWDKIYLK